VDALRASGYPEWRASWYQASVHLFAGRYADTVDTTHEHVTDLLVEWRRPLILMGPVAEHIDALRRCKRTAAAIAMAEQLLPHVLAVDSDYHRALTLRVAVPAALADVAGERGGPALLAGTDELLDVLRRDRELGRLGADAAADLATAEASLAGDNRRAWQHAVDAAAFIGQTFLMLDGQVHLARAMLSEGDRDGARRLIVDTWTRARTLGAEGIASEVRQLARSARVRLDEVVTETGVLAELTRREREVLDLISDGASNRRIATTLFISEKTASVHVSRILAKLGVRTRLEAAAVHHRLTSRP
jgi:DNA-binding CsgD family transcriptional regulator